MKTIDQLKSQIYSEVQNSGFLKNIQSQVKTHVLQLIQKQTRANKDKLGFQYQHPILKKMRNYPLTSLCMDLIQQFLQSFKFKHTLNVFKKQINRDLTINRSHLSTQFSIDLSGKDQSVLLSIVGKIVNGDVRVIDRPKQTGKQASGFTRKSNNFMGEDSSSGSISGGRAQSRGDSQKRGELGESGRQDQRKAPPEKETSKKGYEKYDVPDQKTQVAQKLKEELRKQEQRKQELKRQEQRKKQEEARKQQQRKKQQQARKQKQRLELQQKQKANANKKGKKNKKQEEKPPEDAQGLLADLVGKFELPGNKKKTADEQFKARKAFSQIKQPKQLKPQQSGSNTIRGVSAGKLGGNSIGGMGTMSSFMKFSSFNNQPAKNQQIDQDFDQLQQSKDSTRRNPLYSSSQSGFDKSNGYDQSVDSMAIQDYEYVEKAKKFTKKP